MDKNQSGKGTGILLIPLLWPMVSIHYSTFQCVSFELFVFLGSPFPMFSSFSPGTNRSCGLQLVWTECVVINTAWMWDRIKEEMKREEKYQLEVSRHLVYIKIKLSFFFGLLFPPFCMYVIWNWVGIYSPNLVRQAWRGVWRRDSVPTIETLTAQGSDIYIVHIPSLSLFKRDLGICH